jgi:hypothetical protein
VHSSDGSDAQHKHRVSHLQDYNHSQQLVPEELIDITTLHLQSLDSLIAVGMSTITWLSLDISLYTVGFKKVTAHDSRRPST